MTFIEAVLVLCGAAGREELDENTVETYEALAAAPLHINTAPLRKLLSCGLLDAYQAASIADYRKRNGSIMSFSELGLIDGIGQRMAEALMHFVSLDTAPDKADTAPGAEALLRFSAKDSGFKNLRYSPAVRLKATVPGRNGIFWASRKSYDGKSFSPGSFSFTHTGADGQWQVVAGDFNARFGQGLCCRTGFSLSGFQTPSAFSVKPDGIKASSSFSEALRGVGGSWGKGMFNLNGGFFLGGLRERMDGRKDAKLKPGGCFNASWSWKSGSLGANFCTDGSSYIASADCRTGGKGVCLCAEAAWDFTGKDFAALASLSWKPAWQMEAALNLRWYGKNFRSPFPGAPHARSGCRDEAGVAAAFSCNWGSFSYDWNCRCGSGGSAHKGMIQAGHELGTGPFRLKPQLRFSASYRNWSGTPPRLDLRGDIGAEYGTWGLNLRYNSVWCRERSWLWYAEAVRRREEGNHRFDWNFSLRFTLFKADKWDDRIYVYERDVPGTFSVPAMYGRGWSLSGTAGFMIKGKSLTHRLNARLGGTRYYSSPASRESGWEARLQYAINWKWRSPS